MGKFVLFLSINRYVMYLLEVFSIHFHEVFKNSANIISMTMTVICTTFFVRFPNQTSDAGIFFFGYVVLAMMIKKKWGVISLQRMSLLRKYYSLLDE